jgi:hypothetical protein
VQYLNERSGQILFDDSSRRHVYRIADGRRVSTDFGLCPAAFHVRSAPAL